MSERARNPAKVGYVVLSDSGRPLHLGADGVLWYASDRSGASVFDTREDALGALKRSDSYARDRGISDYWRVAKWSVLIVKEARDLSR